MESGDFPLNRPLLILAVFAGAAATVSGVHRFNNVTAAMGISGQTGLGHAVGWCDIDRDGDLDLAFSNQNSGGFWLYRNDGTVFTDITSSAGLGGLTANRILWGDLTGDDHPDLAVRTWDAGQKLYRNDGSGHFTDITGGSGIGGSGYALADFNNDGAIDVLSLTSTTCGIYFNGGSGSFTYTQVSGSNDFYTAVCFDYDLDGRIDIYAGTYGENPNKLYRNLGSGTFQDVTSAAGVEWTGSTSGVTAGDYDNDGYPDLYLGNTSAPGCKLFRNLGNGTFADVTSSAGVIGHTDTRTVNFIDYNNDGSLDIFVSNHDFYVYSSQLYRNNGNGTFTDVGAAMGLSGQMMGDYFGTGWADFNSDGGLDLFAAGHIDKYVLFQNDSCPGNYLTVRLVGTVSNCHGIGAAVKARAGALCLTRFVNAGEGMHDFHSYDVELGLGTAGQVDSLAVDWPSGYVQRIDTAIAGNQIITIVEGGVGAGEVIAGGRSAADILFDHRPNPCRRGIAFDFRTGRPGMAEIGIYDARGSLVKVLFRGDAGSGRRRVQWDGRDREGRPVPPGAYFCRLATAAGQQIRKLLLSR